MAVPTNSRVLRLTPAQASVLGIVRALESAYPLPRSEEMPEELFRALAELPDMDQVERPELAYAGPGVTAVEG